MAKNFNIQLKSFNRSTMNTNLLYFNYFKTFSLKDHGIKKKKKKKERMEIKGSFTSVSLNK